MGNQGARRIALRLIVPDCSRRTWLEYVFNSSAELDVVASSNRLEELLGGTQAVSADAFVVDLAYSQAHQAIFWVTLQLSPRVPRFSPV